MGFWVSIPRACCCGGPHFSAGDTRKARRLARENIKILTAERPDVIVSDCATCAHTLHDYASFFPVGDPIQADIAVLSEKIVDISAFVLEHLGKQCLFPEAVPGKVPVTVTWHDPCHAVRGLGGPKPPRELLHAIPGIHLVEMDHPDTCCGGAGSYTFRHPGMSQKILDQKIDDIVKTGASIVATACPSCILQLGAGLRRRGESVAVMHVMELVSRSLVYHNLHDYNDKQEIYCHEQHRYPHALSRNGSGGTDL
jgi:glycolate oxidase iron-sulfur subunit